MKAVGLLTTITTILLAVLVLAQASIGVAGTVLNRDGLPIDGATVVVYDSNNNVVARSTTGAGGRFWLALPSGTYTLRLSKPGYVDRVLTFTIGKQTLYTDLGEIVMDYSLTVSLIPSQIELPVLSTASIPVSLSNKGASAENISVSVEKSCDLDVALYAGGMRVTRLLLGPGEAQSLTLQIKTPYMETTTCRVKLSFTG
ncbi:MAG: carboxypeptidase regulatory-like domain-containing protein, partial [Thermofilaceae archaeon]